MWHFKISFKQQKYCYIFAAEYILKGICLGKRSKRYLEEQLLSNYTTTPPPLKKYISLEKSLNCTNIQVHIHTHLYARIENKLHRIIVS